MRWDLPFFLSFIPERNSRPLDLFFLPFLLGEVAEAQAQGTGTGTGVAESEQTGRDERSIVLSYNTPNNSMRNLIPSLPLSLLLFYLWCVPWFLLLTLLQTNFLLLLSLALALSLHSVPSICPLTTGIQSHGPLTLPNLSACDTLTKKIPAGLSACIPCETDFFQTTWSCAAPDPARAL
jgi:hypothetical protein